MSSEQKLNYKGLKVYLKIYR